MTIQDRAQAALDRASVATAGPWYSDTAISGDGSVVMSEATGFRVAHLPCTANVINHEADAAFIAAACEDVPDLSAALLRILSHETFSQIAKTLYGGGGLTAGEAEAKADDVMRLIERTAEGES